MNHFAHRGFVALAGLAVVLSACNKADSAGPAAKPTAPTEATSAKPAPAAANAISFTKLVTDLMTVDDLQTVYPAGKGFTLSAVLKSAPDCTQSSQCRLELSDGKNTYKMFQLDPSNKARLDGKSIGAAVSLSCVPVYEQGSYDHKPTLQLDKSCNVI